jgi:hypothetical protein
VSHSPANNIGTCSWHLVGISVVMEYTFNKHLRTITPCSYLPEILLNSVAAKASILINIFGTYIFADVFVMDNITICISFGL